MKRERVEKNSARARDLPEEDVKAADSKQGLKDDMDDLLDEIDGVLEENAEEFVKGYVQKGGE